MRPREAPSFCRINRTQDWNIPKHLARFSFKDLPGNKISIAVYAHDDDKPGRASQSDSPKPLFSAVYQPISYLPRFPISTKVAQYARQDLRLAQPPLPSGPENAEELVGTDQWCRVMPYQFSSKTSLGWWDLKQDNIPENQGTENSLEHFWPGMGRWKIGAKMEDAVVEFPEPERWNV